MIPMLEPKNFKKPLRAIFITYVLPFVRGALVFSTSIQSSSV
jgi:hypothetical protein